MAVDILNLGFRVDTAPVKNASKDLDKLGTSAKGAGKNLSGMGDDAVSSGKSTTALAGSVKGLIGAYASLASITALIKISDDYTKLTAQLKLATTSQSEFNQAYKNVQDIAKTAQSSLGETAMLYARISNATREMGANQTTVAAISESVALGLKVSGASAAEASSAMLQLSQAFGSGVLRGEEFNAVNEAAPRLMKALADGMGVPIGALRTMAADGKITSDILGNSLVKALEDLREEAKNTQTISGAFVELKNNVMLTAGEMDKATNASKAFAGIIKDIANSGAIRVIFEALAVFAVNIAYVFKQVGNEIGGIAAQLGALIRLDFAGAKFIGEQMKLDAAAARIEVDKLSASILNPQVKGSPVVEEVKTLTKATALATQSTKDYAKARASALKELQDQINEEQDMIEAKYKYENDLLKELDKQKEDAYKKELERVNKLQAIANDNFEKAQREVKQLEDVRQKEFDKSVDDINRIFREGFAGMVRGGKDSWKAFTKELVVSFKTTVADKIYKMFAEPFIFKIVASLLGVTASGAAGASSLVSGGDGGIGSIFGTISDGLGSLNTNVVGSIEKLGVFLSNGQGGLADKIGGALGQYSTQIAGALAFAPAAFSLLKGDIKSAAFQGGGAAIGLALGGPVGGAIGSFLGGAIGGLFGSKKRTPRYSSGVSGTYQDGTFQSTNLSNIAGFKKDAGGREGLAGAAEYFSKSLGALLGSFDIKSVINTNLQFFRRKGAWGYGSSSVDGVQAAGTGRVYNKDQNAAYDDLINAFLGQGLVSAIKVSKLPDGIKKFFDSLTKKEDVADAINTLISLKSQLTDLPKVFDAIRDAIDTTAYNTSIAQLKERFTAVQTYTNLFYTDAEKIDTFKKQMTTQFDALGIALPTSRDGFRALVDSINVVDEATSEQFFGLVALAPAMDAYFKALQQQSEAFGGLADSMNSLDISRFKTLVDYTRAQRYAENGISLSNLPSYDVGTSSVQGDQIAQIHNGERIIPATDNRELMARLRNPDSSALIAEVGKLRQENQAQGVAMVQATQKMAKILDKFDNQGIALSETNNSGTRIILDTRVVA